MSLNLAEWEAKQAEAAALEAKAAAIRQEMAELAADEIQCQYCDAVQPDLGSHCQHCYRSLAWGEGEDAIYGMYPETKGVKPSPARRGTFDELWQLLSDHEDAAAPQGETTPNVP